METVEDLARKLEIRMRIVRTTPLGNVERFRAILRLEGRPILHTIAQRPGHPEPGISDLLVHMLECVLAFDQAEDKVSWCQRWRLDPLSEETRYAWEQSALLATRLRTFLGRHFQAFVEAMQVASV